ncbi:MAG: YdeI/OmpD-associated family protein [Gemmatimonadaceae bacterium]|nr:YdeI/OmpD-associated family protein [Gemmatimonadaceae bacterium]
MSARRGRSGNTNRVPTPPETLACAAPSPVCSFLTICDAEGRAALGPRLARRHDITSRRADRSHDSEAEERRIPPLLSEEEPKHREAAESRDLQDTRGRGEAREGSAVLQAPVAVVPARKSGTSKSASPSKTKKTQRVKAPAAGAKLAAPSYFAHPSLFRSWLEGNHESERELLVGFHKRDSGRESMTWPESVAEALCFGWIDGIRRRVDEHSYSIRFTSRKSSSIWSTVNTKMMRELITAERVHPAGLRAFERRSEEKSAIYAYENSHAAVLDSNAEREFKRHTGAWTYFESCPAWYRRTAIWRIISAKRPETRAKRLAKLIACSSERRAIPALSRAPHKGGTARASG